MNPMPEQIEPASSVALRDFAVDLVDSLFGFTVEFAASPEEHRYRYDLVETRVAAMVAQDREKIASGLKHLDEAERIANEIIQGQAEKIAALESEAAGPTRSACDDCLEARDALRGENAALKARVEAFLKRYAEVEPHMISVFAFRQLHLGPYSGPNWGPELIALKEAIK